MPLPWMTPERFSGSDNEEFISYVINNVPSLRFVYGRFGNCKLQLIYVTSAAVSVYFDDADNATCKSRVGLPYSVLPVAERTIFGFGYERTRGSWIHACNTAMQYGFVLHCCDVMALCTASQISNKNYCRPYRKVILNMFFLVLYKYI